MKENKTVHDALNMIERELLEAVNNDRFMVAIWSVTPEGKLILRTRTTWKFPVDDIPTAIKQLRDVREQAPPLPLAVLPGLAGRLKAKQPAPAAVVEAVVDEEDDEPLSDDTEPFEEQGDRYAISDVDEAAAEVLHGLDNNGKDPGPAIGSDDVA